jgi:hypothetical protein
MCINVGDYRIMLATLHTGSQIRGDRCLASALWHVSSSSSNGGELTITIPLLTSMHMHGQVPSTVIIPTPLASSGALLT